MGEKQTEEAETLWSEHIEGEWPQALNERRCFYKGDGDKQYCKISEKPGKGLGNISEKLKEGGA